MAKKFIPESVIAPSAMKVRRVTFGITAKNPDVAATAAAAYNLMDCSNGVCITDIRAEVDTAVTSTGTFTLTVGNDTDADGFFLSSGLVPGTVGLKTMSNNAVAAAYKAGYMFNSAVDTSTHVVATVGTTKINAGLINFYITYFDANETK